MTLRVGTILASASLVACLDVKPYAHEVHISHQDDHSIDVDGRSYTAGFGGAYPMLSHLAVGDGAELIGSLDYTAMGVPAYAESSAGTTLSPTVTVNADSLAPPAAVDAIASTLHGPAVVQVVVDWSTGFPAGTLGGVSTYTMFPSGEIVRHDKVNVSAFAQNSDTLTSYTSLANAQVQVVDSDDGPGANDFIPPPGNSIATNVLCVSPRGGGDTEIAFGVKDVQDPAETPGGWRVLTHNDLDIVAFDWARATSGVQPGDRSATFHMLLSGPDLFHVPATPNTPFECTDLRLAMEPHVRGDRPYLGFVDGTAPVVMVQTTIDGMYPIEASGANPVVITAQSATQTGFAIEIHFDRATSGIDVTGFPAPQDGELLVQDAGGNTFIVWFPDSLDVGPTVTITPR